MHKRSPVGLLTRGLPCHLGVLRLTRGLQMPSSIVLKHRCVGVHRMRQRRRGEGGDSANRVLCGSSKILSSRGFPGSGAIALPSPPSNGSKFTMSGWVDNTAEITVQVPLPIVWELWQDKTLIPNWMQWIKSVETTDDSSGARSRWTLATHQFGQNFEFSWVARDLPPVKHQKIHWTSEEGLNNRGAVRFYADKNGGGTRVQIQISYEVPDVLVPFGSAVSPLVEQILRADLQRFSEFSCKVSTAIGKQQEKSG